MSWNRIIGQTRVKELLRRTLRSGQVAHAYLFYGPDGVGKDALALEFARALNCHSQRDEACDECESCRKSAALQHPNIQLIVALPVGKNEEQGDGPLEKLAEDQLEAIQEQLRLKAENPYHRITIPKATFIKINSIREIRRQAALSMFETGRKVYIIANADEMNPQASNALLKTLEEPPPNTVLLLTTSRRDQLLPTLVSRCQLIQCDPLEENVIRDYLVHSQGREPESAGLVAKLADGSMARAFELLTVDLRTYRDEIVAFMRAALSAKPSLIFAAVDKLSAGADRTAVERTLRLLQVWLREALLVRERGEDIRTVVDGDLQRFLERFPRANLAAALESVDSSIALLSKNVYLPLILTNLSFDLQRSCTTEPSL
jgi:DNA polymerase-3 subunit delta'